MRGRFLYILWILAAGILYLWSNEKVALLLLLLLVAAVPAALLMNIAVAGRIRASVHIRREEDPSGDNILCVEMTVENRSLFPAFQVRSQMELNNLLTGSSMIHEMAVAVGPRGTAADSFRVKSTYCGRVECQAKNLEVCDFLGLSRRQRKDVCQGSCYVYPKAGDDTGLVPDYHASEEQVQEERYIHKKGNDITEILNLREYQKGDSIKNIHWKLSKKLGHKVVKELDMPTSQDVILLMALSPEQEKDEAARDRVAEKILNISDILLQEQIFYDVALLRENGSEVSLYSIQEAKTRDWYEQRLLDGELSWGQDCVEQYMAGHHILSKYAMVVLVTDSGLEDWYREYPQVLHIY